MRAATWVAVGALLLVVNPLGAADPDKAGKDDKTDAVVGTWNLKFTTPDGVDHAPVLKIAKEGAGLKGEYAEGEKKLKVKEVRFQGGELRVKVEAEHEGQPASVTYKGKPEGDAIKGEAEWEFGGMTGTFDFEGKRVAKAAGARADVIAVWPDGAPGSEKWTQKEVEYRSGPDHKRMVRNVTRPTLTPFLPDPARANGTAIIVCPGGGFRFLSWENEGTAVAEWLRDRGVAAFVLKYRLVDTGATEEEFRKKMEEFSRAMANRARTPDRGNRRAMPKEMRQIVSMASADGRQAVKVVRRHASEWGIAPDRIGIMGFSAGGMVTMGVVMDHDEESRPNFAAPIYGGSTGDAKIPGDAPPLFILCASDDSFAAASSARLYLAWKEAGRPAELHIYSKGGHGFGMAKRGLPVDHWIDRFGDWLAVQGLLTPSPHKSAESRQP